jgi:hypothetical protein
MDIDITNAIGSTLETNSGGIHLEKFLGRGKSGYSYLGLLGDTLCTVKLMHYEPCPYYSFGNRNKVEIEVEAYQHLNSLNLPLPKLLGFDPQHNYLVKEYLEGTLATDLIAAGEAEIVIGQLYKMFFIARDAQINLDYFPANYLIKDQTLYYIDYEFNPYQAEWDLYNWGIYYWANTEGMKQYLTNGDITALNQSAGSGIPIKQPLEGNVENWNNTYKRF